MPRANFARPSSRRRRDRPGGPPVGELYRLLLGHFGPQGWWPAESPFEVLLGAILTQSVTWRNAARAVQAVRAEADLTEEGVRGLGEEKLAALIRPSRFFRQKSRRIFAVLGELDRVSGGSLDRLVARDSATARRHLLAVPGIGEETADAILAYAGGHALFVVDAYTRRILVRCGVPWPSDDSLRRRVRAELETAQALQEFHALLTRLGHRICRPAPLCPVCPLLAVCPTGQAGTLTGKGVGPRGRDPEEGTEGEGERPEEEETEDQVGPTEGGSGTRAGTRRETSPTRLGRAHGGRLRESGRHHGKAQEEEDVTA